MRSHFQPFTDVLREIWPAVTQKVWKTTADDADSTDERPLSEKFTGSRHQQQAI